MEEYLQGSKCLPYNRRHIKRKLEEHYGELIIISGKCGSLDIVTLRDTAYNILRKYYEKPKDCDLELQKNLYYRSSRKIYYE
jgi:hypothetical protein